MVPNWMTIVAGSVLMLFNALCSAPRSGASSSATRRA
jgi:hypothetical protein